MKNTIIVVLAGLFFSVSASAQTTVDSIRSKYQLQAMPEALTLEKTFPVLGNYLLSTEENPSQQVIISLDSLNKGIVWVEGLPEGKFKAYLRKSPATYRVVAQKSESGKQVPEGTLHFDSNTNTLHVALGKKFDEADPEAIFNLAQDAVTTDVAEVKVKTKTASEKSKSKVRFYTATRAEVETSVSADAAKQ